jgi:hypothetical protein
MSHVNHWVRTVGSVFVVMAASSAAREAAAQGGQPTAVSIRESAASLVRSGIATNDARAVLAAAQLLITAERASPGLQRVGPVPADTSRPEEQTKSGVFTGAGLLRLASRIAVEQQDLGTAKVAAELAANADVGLGDAALAKELRAAAQNLAQSRGAAGGPIWADGFIAANGAAEYSVSFQGGYAPNKIDVSASNASADLDCYLYEGKQLVARDNGFGGDCSIKWSQKLSGTMTLRVRNVGSGTYYVIISN